MRILLLTYFSTRILLAGFFQEDSVRIQEIQEIQGIQISQVIKLSKFPIWEFWDSGFHT
jgi:hypothetical protein